MCWRSGSLALARPSTSTPKIGSSALARSSSQYGASAPPASIGAT